MESIDEAIQAHVNWVETLRKALSGDGRRDFNVAKVGDDTACSLGKWLQDEKSTAILGADFHGRLVGMHAAFHEIAAEVVISMNSGDSPDVTESLIAGLEDLSKGIVSFMEFAHRQSSDGPSDFRVIGA